MFATNVLIHIYGVQKKKISNYRNTSILFFHYLIPQVNKTRQMYVNSRIQNPDFWNFKYWIKCLLSASAGYKVHSLLIYKWQTFPTLSTAPWNCPLLLNMLLTWIISAKSQHFLAICKGTGKPKLFLLSEGSLEDSPDPLKRHSKLGISKQKCSSSLTQGEQAWK